MVVTIQKVKELRERTGVGMTKCKSALEEANGDIETAIENLRKAGMAAAVKKEGRETKEGKVCFASKGNLVALVEVSAETDFVVKNEIFQTFSAEMTEEILNTKPENLESFLEQPYSKDPSVTINEQRSLIIQKIGENIQIKRFELFEITDSSSAGLYSHMGGKIVCLTIIDGNADQESLAKDIAMHTAAEAPQYLSVEDIPDTIIEQEKNIARSQMQGKPENIMDKIITGKMNAFYDQVCLIKQKFIKDPDFTIEKLLQNKSKEVGSDLRLVQFVRWSIGQ
jgi:elongation factor Ts